MNEMPAVRAGDIFRVLLKDGIYGYGVVMAPIGILKSHGGLSANHNLAKHNDSSFFYRLYLLSTESPDLLPEELAGRALGPAVICSELFPQEAFTLIGHTDVTEELLQFPFLVSTTCYASAHTQLAYLDAFGPEDPCWETLLGIVIEWGTVRIDRTFRSFTTELIDDVKKKCCSYYNDTMGISPLYAKDADFNQRGCLTLQDEIAVSKALFSCLGLSPDATFDDFARKFGGKTKQQLLALLSCE